MSSLRGEGGDSEGVRKALTYAGVSVISAIACFYGRGIEVFPSERNLTDRGRTRMLNRL